MGFCVDLDFVEKIGRYLIMRGFDLLFFVFVNFWDFLFFLVV